MTLETTVTLTTSQLIDLTKIVTKSQTEVPEHIMQTLKAVIDGRKLCAGWYAALSGSETSQRVDGNNKHQYFIEVLRQIQDLLEHARENRFSRPSPHSQAINNNMDQEQEHLANMFSVLEMEEPSSHRLGQASRHKPKASKKTDNEVTFSLESTEETKTFALWCMLEDLRDVRNEVRALWQDYRAGKVDFSVAGAVTNFAIGLIRYTELEFAPEYPSLQSYDDTLRHIGLQVLRFGSEVFICWTGSDGSAKYRNDSLSKSELAHLFCPRAYLLLEAFQEILGASKPHDGTSEEQTWLEELPKIHEFGGKLRALLPDFKALCLRPDVERVHLSETLGALQDIAQGPPRQLNWSQVSTLQISMDIIEDLGDCSDVTLSQFKAKFLEGLQSLNSCAEILEKDFNLARREEGSKPYADVITLFKEAFADPYHRAHQLLAKENRTLTAKHTPYSVYALFPSVPAQVLQVSKFTMQISGYSLCDRGLLVLSLAYLYSAAKKAGLASKAWVDMDFVVSEQSKTRSFVLEPDNGIAAMPSCFGKAVGMKLSSFRHGQRPSFPSGATILKDGTWLESPYAAIDRLCGTDKHGYTTTNKDLSNYASIGFQCIDDLYRTGYSADKYGDLITRYKQHGKLTPAQLLYCLQEVLKESDMGLRFDYIQFAISCDILMTKIRGSINPSLLRLHREFGIVNRASGYPEISDCCARWCMQFSGMRRTEAKMELA